jgi:hypothetical protein
MATVKLGADRADVWTADSGSDVGKLSLLIWTDEALAEGAPAVEVVMSGDEARALIAELQQGIGNAANALHYWKAQGA